jgi:hypothetical protein
LPVVTSLWALIHIVLLAHSPSLKVSGGFEIQGLGSGAFYTSVGR